LISENCRIVLTGDMFNGMYALFKGEVLDEVSLAQAVTAHSNQNRENNKNTVLIAILTVSFQAIKAAVANPVTSLLRNDKQFMKFVSV
jgi:hypothetical protein